MNTLLRNRHPYFTDYEVSSSGEIISCKFNKRKVLIPFIDKQGRYWYTLLKNGRQMNKKAHQLVLETFVGPCPAGMEVRHYPDNDPSNNNLENLRYSTHKDNMKDMIEHGTTTHGIRQHMSKLNGKIVKWIRKVCSKRLFTQLEIACFLGVNQSLISYVVNRKIWKHI